ncbi:hypothetical protein [Streptomyces sp. NPDC096153]|uniref:hypothetical protein n=1 Tax=Streptomyces sp. NPDC096153 TaxID=3155548 RepID=UPI00332512EE
MAEAAQRHKEAFRRYLAGPVDDAGAAGAVAASLALLAEGAITTAAITGSPLPADQAREAAKVLLGTETAT